MLILFCSKLGIVYWLMSVKMQIWLSYCPTSTAHLLSLWLDVGFVAVCLSEGIGQRSLDLGKLFLFHAFWNSVCGRTKAVAGGFPPRESGRYLEILPGRSQMSVFVLFFFSFEVVNFPTEESYNLLPEMYKSGCWLSQSWVGQAAGSFMF